MKSIKTLVAGGATLGLIALAVLALATPATAGYDHSESCHSGWHEYSYLDKCKPPPPVDVCPNLEGVQETIPEGMVKNENGECVTPPPPIDYCDTLPGVQAEDEDCPPPVDVCPNLDGNQSEVPDGLVKDEQGNCVMPPPPDVCPNIDGTQTTVPTGMVVDGNRNCVTPVPPQVTGSASVICLLPAGIYQISGTVDGQPADKVTPATLPGNTRGVTNVVVTRGDTSVRTSVSTNGDCGVTTTVTTPPPVVTPPVVTPPPPPVVKPPVVKPKPKVKPPVKHKAKPKAKSKPHKKPHKAPKTLSL